MGSPTWMTSMQSRLWQQGWGQTSWPSCLLEQRRSWPISSSSTEAQGQGSHHDPEGTEVVPILSVNANSWTTLRGYLEDCKAMVVFAQELKLQSFASLIISL